ncbi:hypothetical protein GXW83_24115 [Streptacidiphilus sp. PB12-B1b]|uniref:hypothetical protein n=1 Tax=Streptacidiphilus sp. PB12-B1b TaxID=2705012 RepID=UPI0015F9CC28|nr:hypothetical protein [Streptacidiphilus sp. PB12-B1b]QMU78332.1 hypothetical protein GXW83_24115 [Streptacidiphilus sp. PB12-B1b]
MSFDYWIVSELGFIVPKWAKRIFGLTGAELDLPIRSPKKSSLDANGLLRSEMFASIFWLTLSFVSLGLSFIFLVVCRIIVGEGFLCSPWLLLPVSMAAVLAFSVVEYIICTLRARMLSNHIDATRRSKRERAAGLPGRVIPKAYDFWLGFVVAWIILMVTAFATIH